MYEIIDFLPNSWLLFDFLYLNGVSHNLYSLFFFSKHLQVVKEIQIARIRLGKISEQTIHGTGPQVNSKLKYRYMLYKIK